MSKDEVCAPNGGDSLAVANYLAGEMHAALHADAEGKPMQTVRGILGQALCSFIDWGQDAAARASTWNQYFRGPFAADTEVEALARDAVDSADGCAASGNRFSVADAKRAAPNKKPGKRANAAGLDLLGRD